MPADWLARMAAFLRSQHPRKTAECVSARCRGMISAEQVRKWLALRAAPNGSALLWMATAYGPGFLIALFGPSTVVGGADWLDRLAAVERTEMLGARLEALRADLDMELARGRP